jgi:hypothetical protein
VPSAYLSILGHPLTDLFIEYFFLEYGNTPKRVLLRRHPKGGKMIWWNESFWARVSIKNDRQRFGEPICEKRAVTFFSYFNLSRRGTCRTEGSESSYLFLFIIFNPWTDFDFVCCRKDSCAGIPAKLGGAEVWEEK